MSYVFGVVGSFSLLSLLSRNFRVSSRVGSLVGERFYVKDNVVFEEEDLDVKGEEVVSAKLDDSAKRGQENGSAVKVKVAVPLKKSGSSKKSEKDNIVVSFDFESIPEDKKLNIKVEVDPRAPLKKGKTSKKSKNA